MRKLSHIFDFLHSAFIRHQLKGGCAANSGGFPPITALPPILLFSVILVKVPLCEMLSHLYSGIFPPDPPKLEPSFRTLEAHWLPSERSFGGDTPHAEQNSKI